MNFLPWPLGTFLNSASIPIACVSSHTSTTVFFLSLEYPWLILQDLEIAFFCSLRYSNDWPIVIHNVHVPPKCICWNLMWRYLESLWRGLGHEGRALMGGISPSTYKRHPREHVCSFLHVKTQWDDCCLWITKSALTGHRICWCFFPGALQPPGRWEIILLFVSHYICDILLSAYVCSVMSSSLWPHEL